MLAGIGTDLVEVKRIEQAIEKPQFLARVYTVKEQAYCEARGAGRAASYAARFAAKEAVMKALGTGLRGGRLLEIEIQNDALGAPMVRLSGNFAARATKLGVQQIKISLTHTRDNAAAFVVMETAEETGEGK